MIQQILEEQVDPQIASHGGSITLLDYKDRKAYVEMGGGCAGCGMANVTLKQGVEVALKEAIPELEEVVDTTDHVWRRRSHLQLRGCLDRHQQHDQWVGATTITGTTIRMNSAQANGGGIYTGNPTTTVTITQSTVSSNSAVFNGGGLFAVSDDVSLTDSTFTENQAATTALRFSRGGPSHRGSLNRRENRSSALEKRRSPPRSAGWPRISRSTNAPASTP